MTAPVELPPGEPDPERWTNAAISYVRMGDPFMLRMAVGLFRWALAATPLGDPLRADRLSNLSLSLRMTFDGTGDLAALTEAAELADQAANETPAGDPQRPFRQSTLSGLLLRLSGKTNDLEQFQAGVAAARAAVDETPADAPDRPLLAANLAQALHGSYWKTGNRDELLEAIKVGRAAAAAIPPDHPVRALCLNQLGDSLSLPHDPDEAGAMAEACRCWAEVLATQSAPTSLRIEAGRKWASNVVRWEGNVAGALGAVEAMIGLLPELAPPDLSRAEREHRLAGVAGLAGEAASVAIMADRPARAVELLEQARSVLTTLRAVPGTVAIPPPQDIAEFLRQAAEGPIVIVNASEYRCDALILTANASSPVTVVPFPGLVLNQVVEHGNGLMIATEATWSHALGQQWGAQLVIQDTLRWLWDQIAGPVLAALGHTDAPGPGQPWPRIWWCPVGPMTALPLHAAGYHFQPGESGQARAVLDRVISSYTPSVRLLGYARQAARVPAGTGAGVPAETALIVAMPDTPDADDPLTSASQEAQRLAGLMPGSQVLTGEAATLAAVLEALPLHRVAHFACHGTTDWSDAEASRLLLFDHEKQPLTVARISELRLANAELAYLSACSTTRSDGLLADQAAHLSGAFQRAGYQHVVGTLWRVGDTAARVIADDFYSYLTGDGTVAPRTLQSAAALHHAIRRLREKYAASPSLWASHIHAGI